MQATALKLLAGVALLAVLATPSRANLITNGSFETGSFTGWTATGSTTFNGVQCPGPGPGGPPAGNCDAFFGPVGTTGGISQTIATTAGTTYEISYFLQTDGGTPSSFSGSFGGVVFSSLTNPSAFGFTPFTFDITASSNSSVLSFSFRDDPGFMSFDNVSVNAVPGPVVGAGIPGLVLAFGGALAWWRRRSRAV